MSRASEYEFWQVVVLWPDIDPIVSTHRDEEVARTLFEAATKRTFMGTARVYLYCFNGREMQLLLSKEDN